MSDVTILCNKIDKIDATLINVKKKIKALSAKIEENHENLMVVNKKIKKKKEPTRYNIFFKTHMPVIKNKFPNKPYSDIMKLCGKYWKLCKDSGTNEENIEELNNAALRIIYDDEDENQG